VTNKENAGICGKNIGRSEIKTKFFQENSETQTKVKLLKETSK
jgi:hypothetical protein